MLLFIIYLSYVVEASLIDMKVYTIGQVLIDLCANYFLVLLMSFQTWHAAFLPDAMRIIKRYEKVRDQREHTNYLAVNELNE